MKRTILGIAMGMGFLLSGCGGSSTSGAKITTSVKLASNVVESQLRALSLGSELGRAAFDGGQSDSEGLESLKYFITDIALCQEMTLNGSGFSNARGCITVYSADRPEAYAYTLDRSWENLAEIARGSDEGFIDLMDADARAKLTKNVRIDKSNLGSYQWGYINWVPVMKVKGAIQAESHRYRTLDGSISVTGSGNNFTYVTSSTADFATAGAAQEAVVVLNNGGNWFKAQSALEIRQSDIDAGANFAVDLTFNPEGLIKAYSPEASCSMCSLRDAQGNQFSVPMLALTRVLRKVSEATLIEEYVATVSSTNSQGTDHFDIRLEVYSAKGDPTRSVRGVDIHSLFNEDTRTFVYDFTRVSFVESGSEGTVNMLSWNEGSLITGFEQLETIGDSVTVTLHCGAEGGDINFKGCGQQNGDPLSKEVTFLLNRRSELR